LNSAIKAIGKINLCILVSFEELLHVSKKEPLVLDEQERECSRDFTKQGGALGVLCDNRLYALHEPTD